VFRANGFDPETIEQELNGAIELAVAGTAASIDKPSAPTAH
jgi:hypothetical protein